jgi:hypothetical protein
MGFVFVGIPSGKSTPGDAHRFTFTLKICQNPELL